MDAVKKTILTSAVVLSVGILVELEGYESKPYYDIAGVLTECYGNTKGVDINKPKTLEQCTALLNEESSRIGLMLIKDTPYHTVGTLASGISFVYNIGDGAYRSSTYRKKLQEDKLVEACNEMNKWVYITQSGKKVKSKGLQNRRAKEVEVCLSGL